MNAAARKPDRGLIVIVSTIVVLAVVALAVVFTRGNPANLDSTTPAGVVQRYSAAIIDGDTHTADSYLTEAARGRCNGYFESAPVARIVLVSTSESTDSAVVKVSIVNSSLDAGPFGPSEYTSEGTFSLVRVNGKWLVDRAPDLLMYCAGTGVKP